MSTRHRTNPVRRAVATGVVGILFILLIAGGHARLFAAETDRTAPRVAFGIGGLYGIYDFHAYESGGESDGPGETKFSPSFGGGLVLEAMFNNRFGVQTGLWYQHTEFSFYMKGVTSTSDSLLMPIYLLTSFNSGAFTLGLLAGIHLTYYIQTDFEMEGQSMDVLKYMNTKQMGVAGGFEVKLAITRFVDIFVAAVAEKYLTPIFDASHGDAPQYVYGASVRSGVMFRTF